MGNDSYLFRGSGLSTVTQDEPEVDCLSVNEVMRLYSRNCFQTLAGIYICRERFHGSGAFSVKKRVNRRGIQFCWTTT